MKTSTLVSEDELHERAVNVAAQVEAEQKQTPLESAMAGPELPSEAQSAAEPAPDLQLKPTLYRLVKTGVGMANEHWQWSDPGDEWKQGVAELAAVLANKYIGSMAETYSTEGALLIMVGTWVLSNVSEKGIPKTFKPAPAPQRPIERTQVTEDRSPRDRDPGGDWVREDDLGAVPA
jgi:hypothetical protein